MIREESHKYDDMIHLPHHVSKTRPQMPLLDRAAQFSAFAALTGHEEAIKETARLTDDRIELDENTIENLDRQLQEIQQSIKDHPCVTFTVFHPDERKEGGAYETVTGNVVKLDSYRRVILLEDGREVKIDYIIQMEQQKNTSI